MTPEARAWLQQAHWTRRPNSSNRDLPKPPSREVEIECLDAGLVRFVACRMCYKLTAAGHKARVGGGDG